MATGDVIDRTGRGHDWNQHTPGHLCGLITGAGSHTEGQQGEDGYGEGGVHCRWPMVRQLAWSLELGDQVDQMAS